MGIMIVFGKFGFVNDVNPISAVLQFPQQYIFQFENINSMDSLGIVDGIYILGSPHFWRHFVTTNPTT